MTAVAEAFQRAGHVPRTMQELPLTPVLTVEQRRQPPRRMVTNVARFVGRGGAACCPDDWASAAQIARDALRTTETLADGNRGWELEAVRHIRRAMFRLSPQDEGHRIRLARELILHYRGQGGGVGRGCRRIVL